LLETSHAIRLYKFWSLIRLSPEIESVDESIGRLVGLSNSMLDTGEWLAETARSNRNAADEILQLRTIGRNNNHLL